MDFIPRYEFRAVVRRYRGEHCVTHFSLMGQVSVHSVFKIALAYDFQLADDLRLTIDADAINPNDNNEHMNVGGELGYKEYLFLRAGFKGINIDQTEGGVSYGGGIDIPLGSNIRAVVDYAFSDLGRLKGVHRVGIGLKF